jgi:predicted ABC-type ATPase
MEKQASFNRVDPLEAQIYAVERVRERVRQGGHDVPEEVIRRRYEAGGRNFNLVYKRLVDDWFLYDNSGRIPVLLDKGSKG